MYAVFRTGGKQYKAAKDEILVVEKLEGDAGASLTFDSVLMVGDEKAAQVGAPFVPGAAVTAELVEQSRAPKIVVFKKKRRKNHRRRNGHRQAQTVLKITGILTGSAAPAKAEAAKAKSEDGAAPAKKKAAVEPKTKAADKPAAESSADNSPAVESKAKRSEE